MKKIIGLLFIVFLSVSAFSQIIQFNDNGAWCWYQDERAVIDTGGGKLVVGSVRSSGEIQVVIYDLESGQSQRSTLSTRFSCDDHNAPAILVLPNGNYLAAYAGHNNDRFTYWRIYSNGSWGAERSFNWNNISGGTDYDVTYNNLWYLSSEGKIYNFVRNFARSPNMLVSTDQGQNWSYGGLLTEPDQSVGYVNGYFKYCGNGVDRIDFIGTEHHPRDYNTSIYHGYIRGGKSYNSTGNVMDSDITDKNAPIPAGFTRVFAADTNMGGVPVSHCWMSDIQTYGSNSIAVIFSGRANNSEQDHRYIYARFNGSSWSNHYLCKAGPKMYSSEEDYVGLAAIDPGNPDVIYVSTPVDPRNDSTNLGIREIFKGETSNQGASWTWTPVTENSSRDNFRPIVPKWDGQHTALLWWRGTYSSAQNYNAEVVGIISGSSGDSTPTPTSPPDETPLPTTPPNQNPIWSGGPYTLDGSNSSYVDLPDGLASDLYNFSIACWVKLNSLDTWSRIFDFGGDTNVFMMLTPASGNTGYPYFCITTSGNDGEQGINGTGALSAGSWQHLAVTRSGNTGILYINTKEVGRNTGMTLSPADLGNTTNNYIGRSQWSNDPYLNAEIDGFVVYNRALSASEVSTLGNTPPGGGNGALGDANGDGTINIVDALLVARYYVGLEPAGFIPGNADTNCDGSINIVDALLVARYYVGLITGFC
ncbi:MAG: BNR-4 repeat-containing protein [Spirochaetales bacterium]|nr:BNR-4 repeat-containing protein [Spirochaetales bacterium]